MTLPEVVLRYYKQWQIEGNENIIQIVVPPARVAYMVVPTIIHFPICLHNNLYLVHH